MLSSTGYESWENSPEEYREKEFDECYADELRNLKQESIEYIEKDIVQVNYHFSLKSNKYDKN